MTKADYDDYDFIIGMDRHNIYNINKIIGSDPQKKVHMMLEYTGSDRDVADPWYTGDFEATFQDISEGCNALLEEIL